MRLCVPLFLLFASIAPAQVFEAGANGGLNKMSSRDLGSGYSLADGWRFGFRITTNNDSHFGHEFGYSYVRTQLDLSNVSQGGMAVHTGGYNFLLYATPEGTKVRPFVTGGGHFANFQPPGTSSSQGNGFRKWGFNYGGGVKAKVSEKFLIRFDVKQFQTGKPFDLPGVSGMLRMLEVSAGFSFYM
jgi:opacity protein-like surface antigen